jgi:formylglycine-generating enzyme required for sulfatase activity
MDNMVLEFLFKGKERKIRQENIVAEFNEHMIMIPGGSYLMGSNDGEDDERPIHNVLIDSFCLGKYEVTQRQWIEVMNTKPWEKLEYLCEGDNFPAVNVNWYDVKHFIRKLNHISNEHFRLPTEAEWEYACRAGTTSKYAHGSLRMGLSHYAWYYDNAFKKDECHAHEVGKLKPNKWMLYDMMGNVYEWCSDWYSRNYYNKCPVCNPKGPMYGKYKVVRGGDWARTDYFLRTASRRYYSPHYKDINVGFRLAKNVEKIKKIVKSD